jgi:hypothetical protein
MASDRKLSYFKSFIKILAVLILLLLMWPPSIESGAYVSRQTLRIHGVASFWGIHFRKNNIDTTLSKQLVSTNGSNFDNGPFLCINSSVRYGPFWSMLNRNSTKVGGDFYRMQSEIMADMNNQHLSSDDISALIYDKVDEYFVSHDEFVVLEID